MLLVGIRVAPLLGQRLITNRFLMPVVKKVSTFFTAVAKTKGRRMKKIIFSLLFLLIPSLLPAADDDIVTSDDPEAVVNVARPYGEYEFPEMESWSSYDKLLEAFRFARDYRFIEWEMIGIMDYDVRTLRRPTWLYPQDGCADRAEIMVTHIEKTNGPLYKVYAIRQVEQFKFLTPLMYGGFTSWGYHVAPIVRYRNQLYVLDPAISPKKPIVLKKWLKKIDKTVDINTIEIAICHPHSYNLSDSCYHPQKMDFDKIIQKQQKYLGLEWLQIKALGMDPFKVLGDEPPWNDNFFDKIRKFFDEH